MLYVRYNFQNTFKTVLVNSHKKIRNSFSFGSSYKTLYMITFKSLEVGNNFPQTINLSFPCTQLSDSTFSMYRPEEC